MNLKHAPVAALFVALVVSQASPISAQAVPTSERQALIDLYNATAGDAWTNHSNWCNGACPASGTPTFNAPGTECTWAGVTCNGSGNVVQLGFSHNNLVGSLSSLQAFTQLKSLVADSNHLAGSIPPLSGLSALTTFQVTHNALIGSVPDLSGLTSLQSVNLGDNQLSGSLPDLNGLGALKALYVYRNRFSGNVPSLSALANLQSIDISGNQLTGSAPNFAGLTHLSYVSLADNQLSGGFPDLSGAPALAYLDVSYNQLSGPLPADLSATSLTNLYVQFNRFSGALPIAPSTLQANQSAFCPNPLTLRPSANDNAWNAATGQTPWWGAPGAGCDGIYANGLEVLTNGSFEAGLSGWQVGSGSCIWETAAQGTTSPGYGQWRAPAPTNGGSVLISDDQNYADCTLYQDIHVPAGASTATLSAAVGYKISTGGSASGCSANLDVMQPDGTLIFPYVSLNGAVDIAMAPFAPASFSVVPGEVLRLTATVSNACQSWPAGIVLDDVILTLQ